MNDILQSVERYYTSRLLAHGATPAGVDWNSEQSQDVRFRQLLRVLPDLHEGSILDYGCGYGALLDLLRELGSQIPYAGYDISAAMIEAAEERTQHLHPRVFSSDDSALEVSDFSVASGIFNVKAGADEKRWRQYVVDTIDRLHSLSRHGFAFNMLTGYSDSDRKRDDLFYCDPGWVIDHVARRHSRQVALLHDYGLFEFTVIVRLGPAHLFTPFTES